MTPHEDSKEEDDNRSWDMSDENDDDDSAILAQAAFEQQKPPETIVQEEDKKKKTKKTGGVQFGEVRIRKHERVLKTRVSDIPNGLELGWKHQQSERLAVDEYEKIKEETHPHHDPHDHYYKHKQNKFERMQVLAKYGYSPKEIVALEEEKKKNLQLRNQGVKVPEVVDFHEAPGKSEKKHGLFRFWAK